MKILILGINYAPEIISTGVYNTGLAEGLTRRGHDVTVVTAHPYYPQWRTWDGHRGLRWTSHLENGVRVIRCPIYVPASPTGAKRILHYVSFAISAAVPLLASAWRQKPDVVGLVAPSLIASPIVKVAARLASARSWIHIQDFEVGAAIATGLLPRSGRAARVANGFERGTVRLFDLASTISQEMLRKLRSLAAPATRTAELRNWADLSAITPLDRPSTFRDRWQIATPHVALYSGNIGNKQGIEIIVQAAQLLRDDDRLTFVICGEGPYRAHLESLANGLGNIRFHGLQPKEELSELLGLATIHLLPQRADAADLVLPSKLTNMLASGRPVVATALSGTGLAREIEGAGVTCKPEDAEQLAAAVRSLMEDPALHDRLAVGARRQATSRWAYDSIIADFERFFASGNEPLAASDRREQAASGD